MLALIDADLLVYRVGWTTLADPEEIAFYRMDEMIRGILEALQTAKYKAFITSTDHSNFRYDIYPEYKATRKTEKPTHYHRLRDYLLETKGAELVFDQEADDALGIAQTNGANWKALIMPCDRLMDKAPSESVDRLEEVDSGFDAQSPPPTCIVTIDKDLNQIPGWHYNFVKKDLYEVTPDEGLRYFYQQILMGDLIDNVPGIYGLGPVKSAAIVANCKSEKEMYDAVLKIYKGDSEQVLRNGRLLKIRTKEGELWQPPTA